MNLRSKWGCERPPEGLAYEPLKNQRGANDHGCR
jgi:hypothetical protein